MADINDLNDLMEQLAARVILEWKVFVMVEFQHCEVQMVARAWRVSRSFPRNARDSSP